MVLSLRIRWSLRKQCVLGMYTEPNGKVMASELPRSARSNRLNKHPTRKIPKERDPGRVVSVRAEADQEPPLDAKSIIAMMTIYHPIHGKADQAAETALHKGSQCSLGRREAREKPIGDFAGRVEDTWDGPRPVQQNVAADLALTFLAPRQST